MPDNFIMGEAKDGKQIVTVDTTGLSNTELRASALPVMNDKDDETKKYKFSNIDYSGDPIYAGYIDKAGAWYIMQLSVSSGESKYIKGDADYATSWAGRAGLVYGLFNTIF